MSSFEDFLKHHGIKGMRWGVRRAQSSKALSPRKTARLDKRFERNAQTLNTTIKLHNRAADLTNKNDIDRINNKPQYKGQDFTRDSPLRQKYYAEHQKAYIDNLQKAADEMGTNASGTKKYTILEHPDGSWDVLVDDRKVKHAGDPEMGVKVTFNDKGYILSLAAVERTMKQGEDFTVEFLAHHGIKGMRWGFRKGDGGVSTARKKAPSSDDFKKAQAAKAKVTKGKGSSKTKALSNEELQSLVKRMNLEKQYAELSQRDKKKVVGAKFVGDVLGGVAKGQATRLGNQLAADQIDKLLKASRGK